MSKVKNIKLTKQGRYSTVMTIPADLMRSAEKIKAKVIIDPKKGKAKIFY